MSEKISLDSSEKIHCFHPVLIFITTTKRTGFSKKIYRY